MTQVKIHHKSNIQKKMIEILESPNVHGLALFGMARTEDTINPLIIVADNIPEQEKFIKAFYDLCDKHIQFVKTKEIYEKEMKRKK